MCPLILRNVSEEGKKSNNSDRISRLIKGIQRKLKNVREKIVTKLMDASLRGNQTGRLSSSHDIGIVSGK